MGKKLMILGAGYLQLSAIQKAKELGLEVIVADRNPNAIGFNEAGITKVIVSTTDTQEILKAAIFHKIDGIITVASDVPMPTISVVCKELNLIGISPQTALNATNKAEMRKCLKEAQIPVPRFFVAKTKDEYFSLCKNFKNKFIVKASDNSGNRGISLVENLLDEEKMLQAFEYAKSNTRDGRVVIEDYLDGPEFSVEGISVKGKYNIIQVTDKITTGAPYFVEIGHTQPSAWPDNILNEIKDMAKRGVEALGILEGPSHTEIRLTSEGPRIIEIGARLGGGFITTDLVPLSTGVNMIEANIDIALGYTPDLNTKFNRGAAIRFFKSNVGYFIEAKGINKASSIKGIVKIGFFKNIGEYIPELKTGLDRVGYVIAVGESREEAVKRCEEAIKEISIITKPYV